MRVILVGTMVVAVDGSSVEGENAYAAEDKIRTRELEPAGRLVVLTDCEVISPSIDPSPPTVSISYAIKLLSRFERKLILIICNTDYL
jgi:hypothetical protein